jgi:hypothetical protein
MTDVRGQRSEISKGTLLVLTLSRAAQAYLPQRHQKITKANRRDSHTSKRRLLDLRRGNSTRLKATVLLPNIQFPLWLGKTWSYDVGLLERGQAADSKAFRGAARIECRVVGFNAATVTAGTFDAFQCECQCRVLAGEYRPGCGQSTFWYAPQVRNIIRTATESTASSLDLVEFRAARPGRAPKVSPKKAPVPP